MRYLRRPTTSSAISGSPSIINARPCRLYYVEARQSCGLQLVDRILKNTADLRLARPTGYAPIRGNE
jgi:hypothetical protein